MASERRWRWTALLLGAAVLATGCAASRPSGRGAPLHQGPGSVPVGVSEVRGASPRAPTSLRMEAPLLRRRGERVEGPRVARVSPAKVAAREVASGGGREDAFEQLLLLAGLDEGKLPARDAPLSPEEAARLLELLLNEPVTLGAFPPRMAASHLLREVLEGGAVSREELLRRVERFNEVAVLRPDGYLAWTRSGRTQQVAVGTLEWKDGAFRAGPLELGLFYVAKSGVFRHADAQLRPVMEGPPLAEVYDDADYISRSLDGAEEAFVAMYHGMGQFLTRPTDGLASLVQVPEAVLALLASSPEYLERFRYMTRGEQVQVIARLTTQLYVTWRMASRSTLMLTGALQGAKASVPVLSLSAQGTMALRRVAVPVGKAATVLGGPGAAIILQQGNRGGAGASAGQQGYMRPAAEELLQQATRLPLERLSGFRIFGNKG
ncbi:MAG TPA: hypothetical protein VLQ93_01715, partial [Myxococcaceae bacterium]|nr:hypothetical protein [Myxococcaceae bacterium]